MALPQEEIENIMVKYESWRLTKQLKELKFFYSLYIFESMCSDSHRFLKVKYVSWKLTKQLKELKFS